MMDTARILNLRSVELGVRDLPKSCRFYTDVWGLELVSTSAEICYLRASGLAHHALALHQSHENRLLRTVFAASDGALNATRERAAAAGDRITSTPRILPAQEGGGAGIELVTPAGLTIMLVAQDRRAAHEQLNRSCPIKLTHVVYNVPDVEREVLFFRDALGFRTSDVTANMTFLRCNTDHHSVAFSRGPHTSVNHLAFEMTGFDGLMRGCGRMLQAGHSILWGVGRHGPGNNIFAYFLDPEGFVVEYTAEVQQIDEAEHVPGTAEYWSAFPMRPCRWGTASRPSQEARDAMAGKHQAPP